MPKVSFFNTKLSNEIKRFDVHYNKERSFHVKDFPEDIPRILGENSYQKLGGFKTEKELTDSLQEMIDRYHELKKSKRKIIRYALFASTEIRMNRTSNSSHSGYRPGIASCVRGGDANIDYSIGFDFEVLMEVSAEEKKYHTLHGDGSLGYQTNIHNSDILIDWTEERQKAFEALADGMYQLMCKISSALGDKEKALKFIDSQVKLLS